MMQTSLPFNVNYIVYEKGDTAFLLEGYIKLKKKNITPQFQLKYFG